MTTVNDMLYQAADSNNTQGVITALKKGANPDFISDGGAAIHLAVLHGNQVILDHLLRFGADVNLITVGGFSPLQVACDTEMYRIVPQLLAAGADLMFKEANGNSALHFAARGRYRQRNKQVTRDLIKLLVQSGAAINDKSHLEYTPLHVACACNNGPAALELIAQGADVTAATSKEGITPLHLIHPRDFPDVVSALIAAGADVNAEAAGIGSPLYRATRLDAHKSALALLDAGAHPEVDEQEGALEMACKNTMVTVIRKMIEKTRATRPFGQGVTAERLIDAFHAGQHPGQVINLAQTWAATHA